MKNLKKIFNIAVNIVFYPVLATALAIGILFLCGIKPYITMSGSMEPAINTGSVCFVNTNAEYANIKEGDIIAFETSLGGLVTHRVVSIAEEGLETKGDSNDVSDGISTTSENFRGQTVFSVPYLGYAFKALQRPTNLMIVLIVVVGILMVCAVDYFEGKKARENEDD